MIETALTVAKISKNLEEILEISLFPNDKNAFSFHSLTLILPCFFCVCEYRNALGVFVVPFGVT